MQNENNRVAIVSIIVVIMVVIGIFAIPNMIPPRGNMKKDAILADGLAIENASKLYCAMNECSEDQMLNWGQVITYVEGIDLEYYDYNEHLVVAKKTSDGWLVHLEAKGTGEYEIDGWKVPSSNDRTIIIEDVN